MLRSILAVGGGSLCWLALLAGCGGSSANTDGNTPGGATGSGAEPGATAGGTGSGGTGANGTGGTAETGGDSGTGGVTSCDPTGALCKSVPPACADFEAPSVIENCWGPCVPIAECSCTNGLACPSPDTFVCWNSTGHCGPYVH